MSGDRIDYSNERQRHERFMGRAALLDRLDQLLVEDGADRWVVVTGGPGMGKSALLAAWLARREVSGAAVPYHFIRRGEYDWDDPAKLVGSLVAQLEERFPAQRESDADARKHPAARLATALRRVSAEELAPRGERLVILIDGLDEYDPPSGAQAGDPLAAFLPHALPNGVSLLCASRPRHSYIAGLERRDGELVQIDLDDPTGVAENEATVRAFWDQAAPRLQLSARFVDEAVERAGGNMQHAVTLQKHLRALPAGQRRVEDIPRGLAALLENIWERVAVDPIVADGLGILCAAREALTLDELGAVAGWIGDLPRRAFVRGARELLVETQRPDGQSEYRLHHESIRAHIARMRGPAALRGHHAALAQRLATWPVSAKVAARGYALRHALIHRVEAGEWADAWQLAADMSFLETKCRELGAHEAESDVARAAERCRVSAEAALCGGFDDLARALVREAHWLRVAPEAIAGLVWNRLRRSGWSAEALDEQFGIPAEAAFLRVRRVATRQSPALVRDLDVGHTFHWGRAACAITTDGRVVLAARHTLKVWDLESGRELATPVSVSADMPWLAVDGRRAVSRQGYRRDGAKVSTTTLTVWDLDRECVLVSSEGMGISGLAKVFVITPNGRRAVLSGSLTGYIHAQTLEIWALDTGNVISILEGHSDSVNACVLAADGWRLVSASDDKTLKVWDLGSGRLLATLEGHADKVRACVVTADGQRVVSASADRTLKVWDLESGQMLATLEGHLGPVNACAVTADGQRVVSASADGTLKVWDLDSGHVLVTLEGHSGRVMACAVTTDGRRVVSASENDKSLKVWDLEARGALVAPEGHASGVRACEVTEDGQRMISASGDGTLKVWDVASGRILSTLEGHVDGVYACVVTANGRRVVSVSWDDTLKVWDLESGNALVTLEGVSACAATADGRRVVSASYDNTLKVWDLENGNVVATLEGHTDRVTACMVTAEDRRVVSVSWDDTLKVWDLESGRVLVTLRGHSGTVSACVATAEGRVVSTSFDQTLRIWDLESGRLLVTVEGVWHINGRRPCLVIADDRRVIFLSMHEKVWVLDLESGRHLATLEGHTAVVEACAVTADGKHLVSASEDRTLKVWDLDSHACLFTHRGDAAYETVITTATTIMAGDAAGAIWFLDWPASNRDANAIRGHGGPARRRGSRPDDVHPASSLSKRHTILFLAADPGGTDRRALDREASAIQKELERVEHRACFEFETRWALEPLDLLRELVRLEPTVIHFSGQFHGEAAGDDRTGTDSPQENGDKLGLFFRSPDGRPRLVSAAALEEAFGAAGTSVKLVVLSACYSEPLAEALLAHVHCVVGMGGSILEDAARCFAIGFYGGLGERQSVAAAFMQGRAAIALEGLPDGDRPRLKVRAGVDADQLVLAAHPGRAWNTR